MATPFLERAKRVTLKTVPVYVCIAILIYYARPEVSWMIPGAVLILVGEWIRVWAAGHLRKTREVTTTGPYSFVKNPLYLGTLFILIGFCLMAKNLYLLGIGLLIFFAYYAPFKKKREGRRLFEYFGEAWSQYDKAVPDYFPSIRPYAGRGDRNWGWNAFIENSEQWTFLAVVVGVVLITLRYYYLTAG
ncbi:MAG TPA: methyltransferase [Nitrospiria bacterium]|nr:methyltransferase [Nitrospiria bacterium]